MLNRKHTHKTLLSGESTDVFYCHKRIIQQIVRWTDTVSGVGARLIRLESPTKLIGKGLQMLPWFKIQNYWEGNIISMKPTW